MLSCFHKCSHFRLQTSSALLPCFKKIYIHADVLREIAGVFPVAFRLYEAFSWTFPAIAPIAAPGAKATVFPGSCPWQPRHTDMQHRYRNAHSLQFVRVRCFHIFMTFGVSAVRPGSIRLLFRREMIRRAHYDFHIMRSGRQQFDVSLPAYTPVHDHM